MKTYDELSESDRAKLQTFLLRKSMVNSDFNSILIMAEMFFIMTFVIGGIIILAGISLITPAVLFLNAYQSDMFLELAAIFMNVSPLIMLIGACGYCVMVFISYYRNEREKKKDYLVFGYHSFDKALGIKKIDTKKLDKTWKKVKKNV